MASRRKGGGVEDEGSERDVLSWCPNVICGHARDKTYMKQPCAMFRVNTLPFLWWVSLITSAMFYTAQYKLDYHFAWLADARYWAIPKMIMWSTLILGFMIDSYYRKLFGIPAVFVAAGGLTATFLKAHYIAISTPDSSSSHFLDISDLRRVSTAWTEAACMAFLMIWWAGYSAMAGGVDKSGLNSYRILAVGDPTEVALNGGGKGSGETSAGVRKPSLGKSLCMLVDNIASLSLFAAAHMTEMMMNVAYWELGREHFVDEIPGTSPVEYETLKAVYPYTNIGTTSLWYLMIPGLVKWTVMAASFTYDFAAAYNAGHKTKILAFPMLGLIMSLGGMTALLVWAALGPNQTDTRYALWFEEGIFYALLICYLAYRENNLWDRGKTVDVGGGFDDADCGDSGDSTTKRAKSVDNMAQIVNVNP